MFVKINFDNFMSCPEEYHDSDTFFSCQTGGIYLTLQATPLTLTFSLSPMGVHTTRHFTFHLVCSRSHRSPSSNFRGCRKKTHRSHNQQPANSNNHQEIRNLSTPICVFQYDTLLHHIFKLLYYECAYK